MVPQMVVNLPLSKNIYEKLSHSFLTDSRIVTSTPHPRDRQGQRRATRRIVSTAGAAAWLPHSTPRDTRMMRGKGYQFSSCDATNPSLFRVHPDSLRLHDRDKHTQHCRDRQGQPCATHRIVSTAGAAAWLPHSTPRDTRMMRGKGYQFSSCDATNPSLFRVHPDSLRLHDRDKHTQHCRDRQGQPCATRRIVSTAGAAAWLPHSTPRDTRMMRGKDYQFSA
ncbi:MAG: hypothetical protein KatS3mg056_3200 [Chloroflexus sp.]|nr:MAG: hypothetical protein KatS3mg056_3200 [Chloroflexus sp.]